MNLCSCLADESRSSRIRWAVQITLSEHIHVVTDVPGYDEGNRAYGYLVLIGCAGAIPGFLIKRAKHRNISQTDQPELAQQIVEFDVVVGGGKQVIVLIKAGQVLFLAAGNAKSAVAKNSITVDQVTHDLADAPLSFRVSICFALGSNPVEQDIQIIHLGSQHWDDFRLADLIYIALIITSV